MEDYLATHDTRILMYNRVPKTGSSSMRKMLIDLARVCDLATDIVVKQTGREGSWHTVDI